MSRQARGGVTLIEVLVVLSIIAILIAFLLPATRRIREPAARAQCMNNFKQLMVALDCYESTGRPAPYPPAAHPDTPTRHVLPAGCLGPGKTPEDRLSWMVALLPHLEEDRLAKQFHMDRGYAGNLPAAQTRLKAFHCPAAIMADTGEGVTHYIAMAGIGHDAAGRPEGAVGNGFMGYDRLTTTTMIKDGTSNTIALMETRSGLGPWARGGTSTLRGFDPADVPLHGEQRQFGGHDRTMIAAMADGSCRLIRSSIKPEILSAAITIAGGERFDLD